MHCAGIVDLLLRLNEKKCGPGFLNQTSVCTYDRLVFGEDYRYANYFLSKQLTNKAARHYNWRTNISHLRFLTGYVYWEQSAPLLELTAHLHLR